MWPWIILDGTGIAPTPDADTPISWPDGFDRDSPWATGELINGRSEKLFEVRVPPHDKKRKPRYNRRGR